MSPRRKRGGDPHRPGLHKRGKFWAYDRTIAGRRYQGSLRTSNKKTALERYDAEFHRILTGGELEPTREQPLREWLDRFEGSLRAGPHRCEVLRVVRDFSADSGLRLLGDMEGVKVGPDAERWLRDYATKRGRSGVVSARTLQKYASHLRQFGNYLARHGALARNPFAAIMGSFAPTEAERVLVRRPLQLHELRALAAACPVHRGVAYLLAAFSGLRRSELAALKWDAVDLEHGSLRLDAKNTKNRRGRRAHPIPLSVRDLLRWYRAIDAKPLDASGRANVAYSRRLAAGYVLPGVPGIDTMNRDLERAGVQKEAGGRVIDFHALRATYVSVLSRGGVAPERAQKLTRHADVRTTMKHYLDLAEHELRAEVDRIEGPAGDMVRESFGAIGSKEGASDTAPGTTRDGDPAEPVVAPVLAGHAEGSSKPLGLANNQVAGFDFQWAPPTTYGRIPAPNDPGAERRFGVIPCRDTAPDTALGTAVPAARSRAHLDAWLDRLLALEGDQGDAAAGVSA